jgi:pimeloyl-ACP methyl ester carboxylesterase
MGRHVIEVDLLGHGTAPRPTDPADYADVGGRLLASFPDDGQVDAVGFSAGADIVLRLAIAHPERFARLALLGLGDGVFAEGDPTTIVDALEGEPAPENVRGELFRRLAATAGNDPAALSAFIRRPRPALVEADLAAVTCPVLVVLGERDFAGGADRLTGAFKDARFVLLPGVDHFATPSDFGAIDAVTRFIE